MLLGCKDNKFFLFLQSYKSNMAEQKIKKYFVSDSHLGSRAFENTDREREKKLVRFLDSIKNDASDIYFLGDIFDFWYEYNHYVPKGSVRLLGKMAELSDSGINQILNRQRRSASCARLFGELNHTD